MTILAWQRGGGHGGVAAVLLHDWASDGITDWQEHGWVAALERAGIPAFVPDLPGHAESADVLIPPDAEPAAWTAGAVVNDLERLRVDRFFVVGHRIGGLVGGHLAVRLPDRVPRLVLVGCDDQPLIPRAADVATALRDTASALWDPEASEAVSRARRDRRHYLPTLAQWAESATWPAAPRLGAMRTPVLLAVGRDDPRRERAPRLAALFHDGHLITAPGDDGALASTELVTSVITFLEQADDA
jgi:pimeloyl-ACP methyl ester carboxylesterase